MKRMFKPLLAWLLLLGLAVLNGAARESFLLSHFTKTLAFALSGLLLSAMVLGAAVALAPWLALTTTARCLRVGLFWLGLTVAFEFGFGMLQGASWPGLLEQYTFKDGNLWPLVLVVILLSPWIAMRIRRLRGNACTTGRR